MRLETTLNKSVVVIGTFISERDTVISFRQFRTGEIVRYEDALWQIVALDTVVNDHDMTWHNIYSMVIDNQLNAPVKRANVSELLLLQENPRHAPDNIIDAIANILPMPHFSHGSWQGGSGFSQFIRNTN